jgi:hypothetical protein
MDLKLRLAFKQAIKRINKDLGDKKYVYLYPGPPFLNEDKQCFVLLITNIEINNDAQLDEDLLRENTALIFTHTITFKHLQNNTNLIDELLNTQKYENTGRNLLLEIKAIFEMKEMQKGMKTPTAKSKKDFKM